MEKNWLLLIEKWYEVPQIQARTRKTHLMLPRGPKNECGAQVLQHLQRPFLEEKAPKNFAGLTSLSSPGFGRPDDRAGVDVETRFEALAEAATARGGAVFRLRRPADSVFTERRGSISRDFRCAQISSMAINCRSLVQ